MLVICHDFLAPHCFLKGCKALRGTEAVICLPLINQLLCIFQVYAGCLAFTLDIGTHPAVLIRTFVVDQAGILQCLVDDLHRTFHIALLVCIFNAEKEIPALMFCNQVGI